MAKHNEVTQPIQVPSLQDYPLSVFLLNCTLLTLPLQRPLHLWDHPMFCSPDLKLSCWRSKLLIFHFITPQSSFTLKPHGNFLCCFSLSPFLFLLFLPAHRAPPCRVSFVPSFSALLPRAFWRVSPPFLTGTAPRAPPKNCSHCCYCWLPLLSPFTLTNHLHNCVWNRFIVVVWHLLTEVGAPFQLHYELLPNHNVWLSTLCLSYSNIPVWLFTDDNKITFILFTCLHLFNPFSSTSTATKEKNWDLIFKTST